MTKHPIKTLYDSMNSSRDNPIHHEYTRVSVGFGAPKVDEKVDT